MEQDKAFLGKEPIGKLLLKLALPTVAAQMINMLYNLVDRTYPKCRSFRSRGSRSMYAFDYACFGVCGPRRLWRVSAGVDLYGKERQ